MNAFPIIILSLAGLLAFFEIVEWVRRRFWVEAVGVITATTQGRTVTEEQKPVRTFVIKYAFPAAGSTQIGQDEVQIRVPYHLEADAIKEMTAEYKPGEKIKVFHSSSRPECNSLRRSIGLDRRLYSIGFLLLVLLGYYLYYSLAMASLSRHYQNRPRGEIPAGQSGLHYGGGSV